MGRWFNGWVLMAAGAVGVIALVMLAAAIIIAVRNESSTPIGDGHGADADPALIDCIAREYGIPKDSSQMADNLETFTICHAMRDGWLVLECTPDDGAPCGPKG